ncbi:transglycosylase SLT domain-containing protein [Nonomuraea pusilla]|uniref:WXG100 family type VII secretion target n=1 Tax=Nonomuraea pusilla TaxID=46177 RepID=A0A1H7V8Z3_9ACTN|nr:transglycosylase SLT domain-containing protein [Nonomuraea pusilla]SEM05711.1 WXG100 family type VII secretion target [Nonomuraea pusilla]
MSAPEEIYDLPDGATLAALAGKVTGDPAAVRAIAERWRSAAGRVLSHTGELGKAVTTVDLAWEGDSANAFVDYMGDYGRAGQDLHDALMNCASSLDHAAAALESAQGRVAGVCDRLLTRVRAYRDANPDAKDADLEPGIRTMVQEEIGYARTPVREAGEAVTAAKDAIGRFLKERKTRFAKIAAASDQEFVPGSGHRFDWRRTPSYTAHSATTGVGGSPRVGGYGASGLPPAGGGPAPTGKVKEWIEEAIAILQENGVPAAKMNPNDIWLIIQHESGGNPHAINLWDVNATAGHPSKGLMQTIDPVFDAHALDGHRNIYHPIDNIIAGVRYAIDLYGSVSAVPGVVSTKTGSGYRPY